MANCPTCHSGDKSIRLCGAKRHSDSKRWHEPTRPYCEKCTDVWHSIGRKITEVDFLKHRYDLLIKTVHELLRPEEVGFVRQVMEADLIRFGRAGDTGKDSQQ